MGQNIRIRHRSLSKEEKKPKIVQQGQRVDAQTETPFLSDATIQMQALINDANRKSATAEAKLKTKIGELIAMNEIVASAREESKELRKRLAAVKSGLPKEIEVVTIDDIDHDGDVAVITALCSAGGTVDNAIIRLPFDQLKNLIRSKRGS